jgi:hypothetical protein
MCKPPGEPQQRRGRQHECANAADQPGPRHRHAIARQRHRRSRKAGDPPDCDRRLEVEGHAEQTDRHGERAGAGGGEAEHDHRHGDLCRGNRAAEQGFSEQEFSGQQRGAAVEKGRPDQQRSNSQADRIHRGEPRDDAQQGKASAEDHHHAAGDEPRVHGRRIGRRVRRHGGRVPLRPNRGSDRPQNGPEQVVESRRDSGGERLRKLLCGPQSNAECNARSNAQSNADGKQQQQQRRRDGRRRQRREP